MSRDSSKVLFPHLRLPPEEEAESTQVKLSEIDMIWVGGNALPPQYVLNAVECHLRNSPNGYSVNLWVNPEYFNRASWSEETNHKYIIYDYLQTQGIHCKNFTTEFNDELASLPKDIQPKLVTLLSYVNKLYLARPVIAADILRWVIRTIRAGIYCDIDTVFVNSFGADAIAFPAESKGVLIDSKPDSRSGGVSFNNDFIATSHQVLEGAILACDRLCSNLAGHSLSDIKAFGIQDVLAKTGPSVLEAVTGGYRYWLLLNHSLYNCSAFDGALEPMGDVNWFNSGIVPEWQKDDHEHVKRKRNVCKLTAVAGLFNLKKKRICSTDQLASYRGEEVVQNVADQLSAMRAAK